MFLGLILLLMAQAEPRADELRALLERADERGLDPADYRALPLQEALFTFLHDLHFGRANPGLYTPAHVMDAERDLLPDVLEQLIESEDPERIIASIEPPYEGYRRALAALQHYRAMANPNPAGIRKLELALERWRWLPHSFPRPPIVINLPEFLLRAFDERHHIALELRIIAGVAARHSTPIFSSEIRAVQFRPSWDVPLSIQRNEIEPLLARDPHYLERNHFDTVLLPSGERHFRQRPGADNALGLVVFRFPNPYGVYLHDTPARELFQRTRRDFSHGCMRVEHPEQLAAWVLRSQPEWTPQRIAEAMHGDKTVSVPLDQPIPILVVYSTAVVHADGQVDFLPDTYGYDRELDRKLTRR